MRPFTILAAAACGLLAACVTEGPQPDLTKARTLIEQAEKGQAQRYAAPDLQRAREELSSAEVANNKGDYDVARGYAESAAVDADVAAARASAGEALRAAHEARAANRALEQESRRTSQSDLEGYPAAPPATPVPPPPETPPAEPQMNPQ